MSTEHPTWEARAIVTQTGHVDIPFNRAGYRAPDDESRRRFSQLLAERYPSDQLTPKIRELLTSGRMQTREAGLFILYADEDVTVTANTNASAGYCYIQALPTSAVTTGYQCKECGWPSPVGIGYKNGDPVTGDLAVCSCGYSRKTR